MYNIPSVFLIVSDTLYVYTMIQTKVLELFYNVVALAKFDHIGKIYFTEGNLTFAILLMTPFPQKLELIP